MGTGAGDEGITEGAISGVGAATARMINTKYEKQVQLSCRL